MNNRAKHLHRPAFLRRGMLALLGIALFLSCAGEDYYAIVDRNVGKTVLLPSAVTFVDTNRTENIINGNLLISPAAQEKYIKEYRLYWGSDASTKLTGPGVLAVFPKNGSTHTHTFADESVPAGATHLLVYSANDEGEMDTPRAFDIPDLVVKRIADINPAAAHSSPGPFVVFNGRLYYPAANAAAGRELWVWDGSVNALFADINPGANDSNPQNFIVHNSLLLFTASNGPNGAEPWRTNGVDGTLANTFMLADIEAGIGSSFTVFFPAMNGLQYFYSYDAAIGEELRWTDGMTVDSYDLYLGSSGSGISGPTVFKGKMYFCATDGIVNGYELWSFDGTSATLVRDINPGAGSSSIDDLIVYNNRLYFAASDGAGGIELWVSDGTTVGTNLLMDINPGIGDSSPSMMAVCDGKLFFTANDGIEGRELWVSDGTAAGTHIVTDINPGAGDGVSLLSNRLNVINNRVYFAANDGTAGGVELWTSDGTPAGTYMVKNINTLAGSNPQSFYLSGGLLYFSANDGVNGLEPWVSDGTAGGTRMIADIRAGGNSNPNYFIEYNGRVYFAANDGIYGTEPWVYYIK